MHNYETIRVALSHDGKWMHKCGWKTDGVNRFDACSKYKNKFSGEIDENESKYYN